uniref:Uncharacterized protein n=1 Tax=Vespula pensylvanica TaxID=30213 RepID=A0A834NF17_VESPE|nr:hypothetical protein H0235_014593 [Vespula pensylvanica]
MKGRKGHIGMCLLLAGRRLGDIMYHLNTLLPTNSPDSWDFIRARSLTVLWRDNGVCSRTFLDGICNLSSSTTTNDNDDADDDDDDDDDDDVTTG